MPEGGWTNYPLLWEEAGLAGSGCQLWRLDLRAPDPYSPGWYQPHIDHMRQSPGWTQARRIFVIDHEGWAADIIDPDPRIYIWDSTVLPDSNPHGSRFRSYFFWWDWVREIESHMGHSKFVSTAEQHFVLECMLGRQKAWRDFVYAEILQDRILSERCLLSYPGVTGRWEPGWQDDGASTESTDRLSYQAQMTGNRSCFLPWQIYNRARYSLVAETSADRLFFTEKTAKPILAGRLFLLMAAPGSLAALRSLGFETFGDIVDETYDDIESPTERFSAVLEQARYLCDLDPDRVTQQVQERLRRNQQRLNQMDGRARMIQEMKELI